MTGPETICVGGRLFMAQAVIILMNVLAVSPVVQAVNQRLLSCFEEQGERTDRRQWD